MAVHYDYILFCGCIGKSNNWETILDYLQYEDNNSGMRSCTQTIWRE